MAKTSTPKTAKKAKKPYRLVKKKSGKYAVIQKGKKVNGPEKVAILLAEGLIKALTPKAKPAAE
ncbi:MAG: hypothetical protein H7249_07255 [Chitinophagaceae bacterium]|nr:hypothetical protein [Oligoflexus sp.]